MCIGSCALQPDTICPAACLCHCAGAQKPPPPRAWPTWAGICLTPGSWVPGRRAPASWATGQRPQGCTRGGPSAIGARLGTGPACQNWATVSTPASCPSFLSEESSSLAWQDPDQLRHGCMSGYNQPWQWVDREGSGRGLQVSSPLQGLRTLVRLAGKSEPAPQDPIREHVGRGVGRGPSRKALPLPPSHFTEEMTPGSRPGGAYANTPCDQISRLAMGSRGSGSLLLGRMVVQELRRSWSGDINPPTALGRKAHLPSPLSLCES